MDAFEELVREILTLEGYWVQRSVKVELDRENKIALNCVNSPRPEIDLVAYKGGTNELLLIECKSYLDSAGVPLTAFDGSNAKHAERFKLFHNEELLKVVTKALVKKLFSNDSCTENVNTRLCLAAGHIMKNSREKLHQHFKDKCWLLWDEEWLCERLKIMADSGYENSVAAITSKLILRNRDLYFT